MLDRAVRHAWRDAVSPPEHIPHASGSSIGLHPPSEAPSVRGRCSPGDVFVGNDAYEGGGTHRPDLVLGEPIFSTGHIIAWAVNTGASRGFCRPGPRRHLPGRTRIPPDPPVPRRRTLQIDIQELILLNRQVPRQAPVGPCGAQIAGSPGVERMTALCATMAANTVSHAATPADDAERRCAPHQPHRDGTYRSPTLRLAGIDETGHVLRHHRAGDSTHLRSSPPQVRAGLNMVRRALLHDFTTRSGTWGIPTILPDAAMARPLNVDRAEAPADCVHPAAVNGRLPHASGSSIRSTARSPGRSGSGDRDGARRVRVKFTSSAHLMAAHRVDLSDRRRGRSHGN